MQPDRLHRACREGTSTQQLLQLRVVDVEDVLADIPPQSLPARRRRQTSLIRPEILVVESLLNSEVQVKSDIWDGDVIENIRAGRELLEKRRARSIGGAIDENSDNGARVASGVVVHKVNLGSGAVAVDGMLGGSVRVPAVEVDALGLAGLLELEGGDSSGRVGGVKGKLGTKVPVVEGAPDGVWVVELGNVRGGETPVDGEVDGRLLGAVYADAPFCWKMVSGG